MIRSVTFPERYVVRNPHGLSTILATEAAARNWQEAHNEGYPHLGPWITTHVPTETRIVAHPYDWRLMQFDPSQPIERAFRKDCTPEDAAWWFENADTLEGWQRFGEMKRLYAADMAARPRIVRAFAKLAARFRCLADTLTAKDRTEGADTQDDVPWVFRSRQNDALRETAKASACAMTPDLDEQGEPK